MAEHSKVASNNSAAVLEILYKAFLGSGKKQAFSAFLLAIIGYLIYIKNKKSTTDSLKLKEEFKKAKVTLSLLRKEEKATSMLSSSRESKNC